VHVRVYFLVCACTSSSHLHSSFFQGKHYGVPGLLVDGQDMGQTLKGGRAVVDYVRHNGPAILQVTEIESRLRNR